jgi:hypothetical protein
MNLPDLLKSIWQVELGITDIYRDLSLQFEQQNDIASFWEEMHAGRRDHIELLDRCLMALSQENQDHLPGKDVRYGEILEKIDQMAKEVREKERDINLALWTAFYLETISIQNVFNELIKLPREPFFHILSEVHLRVRQNMGRLVCGIENYGSDPELLKKVLNIKEKVIDRRSGEDRRAGQGDLPPSERRKEDRRKGTLVKILWY